MLVASGLGNKEVGRRLRITVQTVKNHVHRILEKLQCHRRREAVRLAYDGKVVLNCAPMLGWLNRLGEGLYNRQTPDGYSMLEAAWSSSGQMSTRFEIARTIGSGSAGLFRAEGSAADAPAFPQLSNALYHGSLAGTFSERTRTALDNAGSPQEWNVLLLSSPEFMFR